MNERFVVICPECGEKHLTTEVEFLNIEEDIQGRDVFFFKCPVTRQDTKSFVYSRVES